MVPMKKIVMFPYSVRVDNRMIFHFEPWESQVIQWHRLALPIGNVSWNLKRRFDLEVPFISKFSQDELGPTSASKFFNKTCLLQYVAVAKSFLFFHV